MGLMARAPLSFAAVLIWSGGCLVDTEKPCAENQVEFEGDFSGCVCAPNSVATPDGAGCTPCGVFEVVKGGQCECDTGYARIAGACQPSALGSACSAEMPCAEPYSFCASGGYCTTSGCTGNQDCTAAYWCDSSGAESFCRQNPSGLGKTCTTSADCAGLEASRCAQGTCQVGGCAAAGAPACFSDFVCCDFTALAATIGDLCIPPSSLVGGKCPGGMDPVVQP